MRHSQSSVLPETEPSGRVQRPERRPAVERIAGWSARHKKTAVLGWLALIALLFAVSQAFGSMNLPSYDPGQAGQAERALHQAVPTYYGAGQRSRSDPGAYVRPDVRRRREPAAGRAPGCHRPDGPAEIRGRHPVAAGRRRRARAPARRLGPRFHDREGFGLKIRSRSFAIMDRRRPGRRRRGYGDTGLIARSGPGRSVRPRAARPGDRRCRRATGPAWRPAGWCWPVPPGPAG